MKRILLVEDDADLRDALTLQLEQAGYLVMATRDPTVALRVVSASRGSYYALITDLDLPKMSGAELIEKLAEAVSLERIGRLVMMSGKPEHRVRQSFTQESLFRRVRFLSKPFSGSELEEVLSSKKKG